MKAQITLDIKAEFIRVNGGYNAIADIFACVGTGSTKAQAEKSLKEALNLSINWCIDNRTLFEALEKEGFKQKVVIPKSGKGKSYKKLHYDIPLSGYGKEKERLYA